MGIENINTFDYSIITAAPLQVRKKGNQGRRNSKRKYKDLYCAFDIETTNDFSINQSYMYVWQFQIDEYTIIGRTWEEFNIFCERITSRLKDKEFIMVYVHNLSFEFTFLKGVYDFQPDEVFAIERRKVLKCQMFDHLELRCSYLLTNMSLAVFTKKMGVTQKLSGTDYDYSKIRYPWTELTPAELEYCITDVKALVEALKVYFSIENDNYYTIPYTATGYVRRDIKRAMRHYNKNDLQAMQSDFYIFEILREAFRGGNVHCNRYYSNIIVENVSSYDRVSSYPDVQINELFPMSPWVREDNITLERVCRWIYKHHRACLMRVGFTNIRLKNPLWGCPYIAKHKCRNLGRHDNDNGRILDADFLELSVTDLDLKCILEEYIFDDIIFYDFYHCRYGRLPLPLRTEIIKYFEAKTELKNVPGQELFYGMAKAKLNSIYGLTCQSPIRQTIDYINDEFIERCDDETELLTQHNNKAFLVYSWGVWTTAHARRQLENAMNIVGPERFVYCDTDSIKFIDDGTVNFNAYNKSRKTDSIKNGGVAYDKSGKPYYLGLFEYENTARRFRSMGAKKYCYEDQAGQLHLTVAGVGKRTGALELAARGGIEAFTEGFIFYKAGGTESIYNDITDPFIVDIDGKSLKITSNVLIKDSMYTLGITGDYKRILENPYIWLALFK